MVPALKPLSLLTSTGFALYGDRWQSPLARDLGLTDRHIRFWAAGHRPVPDKILPRLLELVERA